MKKRKNIIILLAGLTLLSPAIGSAEGCKYDQRYDENARFEINLREKQLDRYHRRLDQVKLSISILEAGKIYDQDKIGVGDIGYKIKKVTTLINCIRKKYKNGNAIDNCKNFDLKYE